MRKTASPGGRSWMQRDAGAGVFLEVHMHEYGDMERSNWTAVLAGLCCFVLGFVFLAIVGENYHGLIGFLAPFFLIGGLVVIAAGLIYPSNKDRKE